MPKATPHHPTVYPMRIQARGGSLVERRYYASSRLPGLAWPSPAAIAQGINPSPLEDLIFHGGKTVAHMGFKNLYMGSQSDWIASNVDLIDKAITRAMQDR